MRQRTQLFAVAVSVLMVGVAIAPAVLADESDGSTLETDVQQEHDTIIITVTKNSFPVENASVLVQNHDDGAVLGEAVTENGTVEFSAPDSDMDVTVITTFENESSNITASLDGPPELTLDIAQDAEGNVSITVVDGWDPADGANISVMALDNSSYADTGDYENVPNGTLVLDPPNTTVNVNVSAEFNDSETSETTTLHPVRITQAENFGQQVSAFVHDLHEDDTVRNIGPLVSTFVTENNPGTSQNVGPPTRLLDENSDRSLGPPARSTVVTDHESGPPEHARNASAEERPRGPPEHAGAPS